MSEKYKCDFCCKEFKTASGKNGHTPYCKANPNKKNAWNKGLTAKTNDTVKKNIEGMKSTKNSSEWKKDHQIWNKGLTIANDSVNKNTEGMKRTKNSPEWKKDHLKRVYDKYDGLHYTQTPKYKEQRKKDMIKKYGVEHPMQCPEIYEKCCKYKHKPYTFPSGKIVKIQGYENYALDVLIGAGINEKDIIVTTKYVPRIEYIEDGSKHTYYPDIFIKSKNLIIEVKSTYTISTNKRKNLLKHEATIDIGLTHEIWIIDNGKIIRKVKNLHEYYNDSKK